MLTVYLGHGASGTAASMKPFVDGLEARGVPARTVPAEGKLRQPVERAMETFRETIAGQGQVALGGQSYGGRVASMVAAEDGAAGLVLFCYPLHRPGYPDQLRTWHWNKLTMPILFLSGEADPFAKIELLRKHVATLPKAELHTYPGVGHGLNKVLDDALDRAAAFLKRLK